MKPKKTGQSNQTDDDKRAVFTVDEVAKLLGVSRLTAYSYIRLRTIPSFRRAGGRIMVPKDALRRLLGGESSGGEPKQAA
jgi:excisionase family DNA binding protein